MSWSGQSSPRKGRTFFPKNSPRRHIPQSPSELTPFSVSADNLKVMASDLDYRNGIIPLFLPLNGPSVDARKDGSVGPGGGSGGKTATTTNFVNGGDLTISLGGGGGLPPPHTNVSRSGSLGSASTPNTPLLHRSFSQPRTPVSGGNGGGGGFLYSPWQQATPNNSWTWAGRGGRHGGSASTGSGGSRYSSHHPQLNMSTSWTGSASLGGGSLGGTPGRTIREYEDGFKELRKENFNLKLRIYFLEERMGLGKSADKDTLVAENLDLKVQLESCRQELLEKNSLLVEASQAIEALEKKQPMSESSHSRDGGDNSSTIHRQETLTADDTDLDFPLTDEVDIEEELNNFRNAPILHLSPPPRGSLAASGGKQKAKGHLPTSQDAVNNNDKVDNINNNNNKNNFNLNQHGSEKLKEDEDGLNNNFSKVSGKLKKSVGKGSLPALPLDMAIQDQKDVGLGLLEVLEEEKEEERESRPDASATMVAELELVVKNNELYIAEMQTSLSEREKEFADLQTAMSEKTKQIENLQEILQNHKREADLLLNQLNEKEVSWKSQLKEKDLTIQQYQFQLNNSHVKHLHDEIEFKNQELSEFQSELRVRNEKIAQLEKLVTEKSKAEVSTQTDLIFQASDIKAIMTESAQEETKKLKEQLRLQTQERKLLIRKINTLKDQLLKAVGGKASEDGGQVLPLARSKSSDLGVQCDLGHSPAIIEAYQASVKKYRDNISGLKQRLAQSTEVCLTLREQLEAILDVIDKYLQKDSSLTCGDLQEAVLAGRSTNRQISGQITISDCEIEGSITIEDCSSISPRSDRSCSSEDDSTWNLELPNMADINRIEDNKSSHGTTTGDELLESSSASFLTLDTGRGGLLEDSRAGSSLMEAGGRRDTGSILDYPPDICSNVIEHLNEEIEKRDVDLQQNYSMILKLQDEQRQKDAMINDQADTITEYREEILRLESKMIEIQSCGGPDLTGLVVCPNLTNKKRAKLKRRKKMRARSNNGHNQEASGGGAGSKGGSLSPTAPGDAYAREHPPRAMACAKALTDDSDSHSGPEEGVSFRRIGLPDSFPDRKVLCRCGEDSQISDNEHEEPGFNSQLVCESKECLESMARLIEDIMNDIYKSRPVIEMLYSRLIKDRQENENRDELAFDNFEEALDLAERNLCSGSSDIHPGDYHTCMVSVLDYQKWIRTKVLPELLTQFIETGKSLRREQEHRLLQEQEREEMMTQLNNSKILVNNISAEFLDEKKRLEFRLDEMGMDKSRLESRVEDIERENSRLESRVEEIGREKSEMMLNLEEEICRLQARLDSREAELEAMQSKKEELDQARLKLQNLEGVVEELKEAISETQDKPNTHDLIRSIITQQQASPFPAKTVRSSSIPGMSAPISSLFLPIRECAKIGPGDKMAAQHQFATGGGGGGGSNSALDNNSTESAGHHLTRIDIDKSSPETSSSFDFLPLVNSGGRRYLCPNSGSLSSSLTSESGRRPRAFSAGGNYKFSFQRDRKLNEVSSPDLGVDFESDPFSSLERTQKGDTLSTSRLNYENKILRRENEILCEKLTKSKQALQDTLNRLARSNLQKQDQMISPTVNRRHHQHFQFPPYTSDTSHHHAGRGLVRMSSELGQPRTPPAGVSAGRSSREQLLPLTKSSSSNASTPVLPLTSLPDASTPTLTSPTLTGSSAPYRPVADYIVSPSVSRRSLPAAFRGTGANGARAPGSSRREGAANHRRTSHDGRDEVRGNHRRPGGHDEHPFFQQEYSSNQGLRHSSSWGSDRHSMTCPSSKSRNQNSGHAQCTKPFGRSGRSYSRTKEN